MKKTMKWILPILLVILLIGSAGWYMFVYDPGTVQSFLNDQAANLARSGHFEAASWLYSQSSRLTAQDGNGAIELAKVYRAAGNYTKAESTLARAIAENPSAELYMALSGTYVEQDKLLDAVNMLDNITDETIRAQLEEHRPVPALVSHEPGLYNEYISLSFTCDVGSLYVTSDGEYPSLADGIWTEPIKLPAGETKILSLVVGENGLVSPLTQLNYTVVGVVEPVTLADDAVEAKLREKLLFAENTVIYTSDLWTITEFEVPAETASLEDLKWLTELKKLTVPARTLESLDFLRAMTELEELTLSGCTLPEDISPIGTLAKLKVLNLSGCGLTTVAKLEGASALTSLDLSSNAIGDITVLGTMPNLTAVNLAHNAVTNLGALASLSQLQELDVSYNSVGDISPVSGCASLKKLDITHNTVVELAPLASLTGLTHFYAGYNDIVDVSVLANLTELTELNISNNILEDISTLKSLNKLTDFDFSYNDVRVLPAFDKSCALVKINGEHNFMEDISALGGMKQLTHVYMDYNNISDISFLADCPNLVVVNVYGTKVTNVDKLLQHSIIVNYDPT